MLLATLCPGVGDALAGLENLLGGLALPDLSLAEKSRTPTLLLTVEAFPPLKQKCETVLQFESTKGENRKIKTFQFNFLEKTVLTPNTNKY